jgi:hypothetical protein
VEEAIEGERDMRAVIKMRTFKWALAVAAILVLASTASAKKPASLGVPGDLSADRTSVTVSVTTPACFSDTQAIPPPPPAVGSLSVYIFQSVGRLINIGTSNTSITCDGTGLVQDITVNAVSGLTFQPGPATLLIRFSAPQDPNNPGTVTITETGSRIDLH